MKEKREKYKFKWKLKNEMGRNDDRIKKLYKDIAKQKKKVNTLGSSKDFFA